MNRVGLLSVYMFCLSILCVLASGQAWPTELRLVGGSGPREGRVEVKKGDNWGTVCDDSWDDRDAEIVCRQLGFVTNGTVAGRNAMFGQGNGEIMIDDVNCSGTELSLSMCQFNTEHNCDHSEDASVICNWQIELRLVGGSGPHEGRVEVKRGSRWGTICDDSWDDKDADVVCRQLGIRTNGAVAEGNAQFGEGNGTIMLDEFKCNGTESTLAMCEFITNHNCGHSKDASVTCNWPTELRLVGGSGPHEGRVEVKRGSRWGTICDDSWDDKDAEVVCRQLGIRTNGAVAEGNAQFGEGDGDIMLHEIKCNGNESTLGMCEFITNHNCGHKEDASVTCNWSAELRLVGGSGPNEGRVEVKVGDNWGTICDDSWDDKDAEVVCRQLGFTTNGSRSCDSGKCGHGSGGIVMNHVNCNGTELSLDMCSHDTAVYCNHSEDASVICNWSAELRLVGGSGPHEGRVEVKVGDNWGTICDDSWDDTDAEVVCRQLGFTTSHSLSLGSASFGRGNGSIIMNSVNCNGNELSLDMCGYEAATNCDHSRDVSVICNWSAELRLVGGSGPHEGRVEVKVGDNWGTICDDSWDNKDAEVVCRQLGFTTNGSLSLSRGSFGQGHGSIVMDDVNCTGYELSLHMCKFSTISNCDHSRDASVICINMEVKPVTSTIVTIISSVSGCVVLCAILVGVITVVYKRIGRHAKDTNNEDVVTYSGMLSDSEEHVYQSVR